MDKIPATIMILEIKPASLKSPGLEALITLIIKVNEYWLNSNQQIPERIIISIF